MNLSDLAKLAQEQIDAEHAVELAEINLKAKKEALRLISEGTIPEVMEELELDTITTNTGLTVTIKDALKASITQANKPKALAWLRKHKHEKIIKAKLIVTPADDKENVTLQKKLEKYQVEATEGVHASTLKSFVKELLEDGKNIPEKLFGIHKYRVSKITVK